MTDPELDVTALLAEWSSGNRDVHGQLFELVYAELRNVARGKLSRERTDHTLQPTALVNEAYLRLINQDRVQWQSRAHFFGIASQMMRRILVDHARKRLAAQRGGGQRMVTLDEGLASAADRDVDLLALDEALGRLAKVDPEQGKLVELRYFGGLTIDETAEVLGVSESTVKREWSTARVWLLRELHGDSARG